MSKMNDIEPTTRIAWWSQEYKDEWEPKINRVRKLYNDAEIATFLVGMRDIYIYHINSNYFDASYDFLRKNDLVYFPTNKSGIYQGFSHKHMPLEKGKEYHLYGAVIKRIEQEEIGKKFVEANTTSNHEAIGELLGYPECCRNFFSDVWGKISVDPIYEGAENTESSTKDEDGIVSVNCHPYCNNMLRYIGIRITPHIPHSMNCEETIKQGEQWIEIMKQIDSEATEWLIELLSMPCTWDTYKQIAIIDTPLFRLITNSDKTMEHKIVNNLGWSNKL